MNFFVKLVNFIVYSALLLGVVFCLFTCSVSSQMTDKDSYDEHTKHNQSSMDRLDEMARKSAKEKYGDQWCHHDSDWKGEC